MSLASEFAFQSLSCTYKMMGWKQVLRPQRKFHSVDCAVGNTPARILHNLDIG